MRVGARGCGRGKGSQSGTSSRRVFFGDRISLFSQVDEEQEVPKLRSDTWG